MGVLRVGVIVPHPTTNNKIRLQWSENVNTPAATTAGNYTFTGGVTCSAAAMVAGTNAQTDLTLSGLVNGTTYTVTVANVQDAATSTAIVSPNEKGAFIWRETGDNNLNGVVEVGGMITRANRNFTGDQLLGYNVLGKGADTELPIITNVSPTPGTNILPSQVISFDVTDNLNAFRRIVVTALYPSGLHEIVHNGDGFTSNYTGSSRSNLSLGYHYSIIRTGGWTIGSNPTFLVYAIDTSGNEAL